MSVLIKEDYVNPTSPLWALNGTGGGVHITAGAGITVSAPTGNITITNDIIPDTNISNGAYVNNYATPLSVNSTADIATINQANFYKVPGNFYTAGITVSVDQIVGISGSYLGDMAIMLEYDDNIISPSVKAIQNITVDHTKTNVYNCSLVIGFQFQSSGLLKLRVSNYTNQTLNSFRVSVLNFYCVDNVSNGLYNISLT